MIMPSRTEALAKRYCEEAIQSYGVPFPDWFYYLSHHSCNQLDHCLRIQVPRRKPYFVCARCAGSYLGFLIGFLGILIWNMIPYLALEFIMLTFAMPVIVDWGSQYLSNRTSTNRLRLITGFLYGFVLPLIMFQIGYWAFVDAQRVVIPLVGYTSNKKIKNTKNTYNYSLNKSSRWR